MRVDEFDFDLPPERIALRPADPREAARLLVVRSDGTLEHRHVGDLPDLLKPKDCMVFNDTKVIAARLRGLRHGRGDASPKIEVLLHRRLDERRFSAFARPGRKLVAGDFVQFAGGLEGRVETKGQGGEIAIAFNLDGRALDAAVARIGEMPLPPYIASKRPADDRDLSDYQTVFARREGSVAAPTAGLHFTPQLLERLGERGISHALLTLHVGAGTFLPVSAEDTSAHRMHSEWASLTASTANQLNAVRDGGGRIAAVGTTSLRTLEAAASPEGRILPFEGETDIFITPGYRFKAVDLLMTNFHLPRSTLFMLVCAFCGLEVMKAAYAEAIRQQYRFYSYGDLCLLFRARP